MSALQKMVNEIKSLEPMPQVANQILALVEDPNSSLIDVADIISYDPSLTANLLKLCNSAYFGLPRKIESVHDAVNYLGLEKIIDLTLLKCSSQNLLRAQKGYDLHKGELWRQSVSSAFIARELAHKLEIDNKHLIFTAALLKDIGKVILDGFVAHSSQKIYELVENKQMSFAEAEKQVIGIDHAELGGLVAKQWRFSSKMVYIIRNHHMVDASSRKDLETAVVYLADTICMMLGIGVGFDGLCYRFYESVLDRLHFSEKDLQEIIAAFGADMQKIELLFEAA